MPALSDSRLKWAFLLMGFASLSFGRAQEPIAATVPAAAMTELPRPLESKPFAPLMDPAALVELQAHARAVGSANWKGVHASGLMTLSGSTNTSPADLTMLPQNVVRLSVKTDAGENLTILHSTNGYVQYAGGPAQGLSSSTVTAGLFPFDLPAFVASSPASYRVSDRGLANVDGVTAHRISIESTVVLPDRGSELDTTSATDFYFDPGTHLLVKSAANVYVPGAKQHRFLRVTSYSGYKAIGTTQIPSLISETLDGVSTWSLQLTAIELPASSTAVF